MGKPAAKPAKSKPTAKAKAKAKAPTKPTTKPPTKPTSKPTKRKARAKSSPLKDLCRSLPGTTEDVKWGDDHVFSVGGKMYAGFDLDGESEYGFKCDDDDFDRLTERPGIIPAPYAARFGWVKVERPDALKPHEAEGLLRKAHGLVLARLPKRVQREILDG